MNAHFRNALAAITDSINRIDPTVDTHTFNQLKTLEAITRGLQEEFQKQNQLLDQLQNQVQALQSRSR